MASWLKIYRHNIYSIIGTLVFHILLVGMMLLTEMERVQEIREKEVVIEIPLELMEQVDLISETMSETTPVPNDPASEANFPGMVSNRPSNRGVTGKDQFFDENYQKEVDAAKNLSSDVNRQLAQEIVDINSIQMPEDVTEGREKEQISNVVYSGESNIEYHLSNRYHLRLPIPVYLARGGGVVTVEITVNREGKVVSARTRQTDTAGQQIYLYARTAAQRTVFNADPSAPEVQTGTIRYTFIPQ